MEVLNLIRLSWGWVSPYISLTYSLYRWVPPFLVPEMFGDNSSFCGIWNFNWSSKDIDSIICQMTREIITQMVIFPALFWQKNTCTNCAFAKTIVTTLSTVLFLRSRSVGFGGWQWDLPPWRAHGVPISFLFPTCKHYNPHVCIWVHDSMINKQNTEWGLIYLSCEWLRGKNPPLPRSIWVYVHPTFVVAYMPQGTLEPNKNETHLQQESVWISRIKDNKKNTQKADFLMQLHLLYPPWN